MKKLKLESLKSDKFKKVNQSLVKKIQGGLDCATTNGGPGGTKNCDISSGANDSVWTNTTSQQDY